VVGFAASYDQGGFYYQCPWRLQDPEKEMIEDLENILVEQLKYYQSKIQKLHSKIMYYRDGVSEGQLLKGRYFRAG
jgi:eukaryotic translation initiation factor 2C